MTKDRVLIKASDLVADIRAGMTTSQLMSKYSLSARECQSLFHQLEEHVTDPRALYQRGVSHETTDDSVSVRLFPRLDVPLPLPAYNVKRPDSQGCVLDVSKGGVRIQGIEAQRLETLTLVIRADALFDMSPVVFDAQCRWVKRKGLHGMHVAGFQITDLSERNTRDIHRLVQAVELASGQTDLPIAAPVSQRGTSHYDAPRIVWTCPACHMPQTREHEECPQCGIIVSKYLSQLDSTAGQIRRSVRKAESVSIRLSVPKELWNEAQAQGGDSEELVVEALDFYLKSRKLSAYRMRTKSPGPTVGASSFRTHH